MKIGEFQGVEIFLDKYEDPVLILNCYFNNRELKIRITKSNVEIEKTTMEEAQAYYISNSIKNMYNELVKKRETTND